VRAERAKAATLLLAIVAAMAPTACGGGSGTATDAATDTGTGADAVADAGVTACDPAAQDCVAGSECDFGCQGSTAVVACRADNGSGALGAVCSGALPCAKGSGCLSVDAGLACRKYCAGDGDCATGERCHNVTVSVACSGSSNPLLLHYCY
jgi:hypothetical protein